MGAVKHLSENARTFGYYRWLCDVVELHTVRQGFDLLLRRLHNIPFEYKIPRDIDRVMDAKLLREDYYGSSPDNEGGAASVLEVLVGIAQRLNDMDMEEIDEDRTARWFWELISNLELDKYTDELYYEVHADRKIDRVVTLWLERKYEKSGKGGLFPLKEASKDQRKVEIWYQMSSYLQERYLY